MSRRHAGTGACGSCQVDADIEMGGRRFSVSVHGLFSFCALLLTRVMDGSL